MTPLFSIVVPTYGRPEFLGECLASILQQTVEDFEVIVVDDASPEPVELPVEDARVRLLRRDTNGGPAAARNTGMAVAMGTYLAFCDDDDLFAPQRLQLAVEGLERAPVACCFNRYLDMPAGRPVAVEGDVADTILDDMAPHLGRTALRRELAPRLRRTVRRGRGHRVVAAPGADRQRDRHDRAAHRLPGATARGRAHAHGIVQPGALP